MNEIKRGLFFGFLIIAFSLFLNPFGEIKIGGRDLLSQVGASGVPSEKQIVLQYGQPITELGISSYTSAKDVGVNASLPNSGFNTRGASSEINYRYTYGGLYWFDLSVLPANAVINDAKLVLTSIALPGETANFNKVGDVPIYLVQSLPPNDSMSWDEGSGTGYYDKYLGASWLAKKYTTGVSNNLQPLWSNQSGRFATGDLFSAVSGSPVGQMHFVSALGSQTSDNLASAISEIIANDYKYEGFLVDRSLLSGDVGRQDHIATKEYAEANKRPALQITYTIGETTPPDNDTPPPPPVDNPEPEVPPVVAPDTEAPSTPSGFSSPAKTADSVSLVWSKNTETDLASYKLYRNGNLIGTYDTSRDNVIISDLSSNTSYTFQLSAVDSSNNESAKTSNLVVKTDNIIIPVGEDLITKRFGECTTCQVKGVTLDNQVSQATPTVNNGNSSSLVYRYATAFPLFRFDVSTIPAGTKVEKAVLKLFKNTDYKTGTVGVSKPVISLLDPAGTGFWNETEANFNSKKNGIKWSTSGGLNTVFGPEIGSMYFKNWLSGGQDFWEADITAGVQNWVNNPASNLGFVLPGDNLFNKSIWSKEATDPSLRPYLEITYRGVNDQPVYIPTNLQAKHYSGQTFLTWKEVVTGKNETSYRIYRSNSPINSTNLSQAELIDQVYQGSSYFTDSIYENDISAIKQPNLAKAGVSLATDSGLYVYPVEKNERAYYAVTAVVEGNESRNISGGNNSLSGGVNESIGIPDAFPFNVHGYGYYNGYIMWLGRFNPANPSDVYGFNNRRSAPFLFALTLPYKADYPPQVADSTTGLQLGDKYPLTVYLHASGKTYFQSEEGVDNCRYNTQTGLTGGFCLAFQDGHFMIMKLANGQFYNLGQYIEAPYGNSYYSGWNSNYIPTIRKNGLFKTFSETKPFSEGKNVMYTEKSIEFVMDWLLKNSRWSSFLDNQRVYFTGGSLGAGGSLSFAIHNPEKVATLEVFQGKVSNQTAGFSSNIPKFLGSVEENIKTPEGEGVYDYFDLAQQISANPNLNYPPIRMINGKKDTTIVWSKAIIDFYQAIINSKTGLLAYFDQSNHNGFESTYFPELKSNRDFVKNQNEPGYNLFHFALNESYPVFNNFSLNDNPGNGDPTSGDLRGGINRYIYWDKKATVDLANKYEVKISLLAATPVAQANVSVTPRRIQRFSSIAGQTVTWTYLSGVTGEIILSGQVVADSRGLYTIDNLPVTKESRILRLTTGGAADLVAPAKPTGLREVSITQSSISLLWEASRETDLSGYRLYVNNQPVYLSKTETNYILVGLSPKTRYTFQLSAVDTSLNESEKSTVISLTTAEATPEQLINLPPSIKINPPIFSVNQDSLLEKIVNLFIKKAEAQNLPTYNTSQSKVSLTGTALDDRGIANVSWKNNRGGGGYATSLDNWQNWGIKDIALLAGENIITVTVEDLIGLKTEESLVVNLTTVNNSINSVNNYSGGGGGGGGGSGRGNITVAPVLGNSSTNNFVSLPKLTGPFAIGMRSEQVKVLQQYLSLDKTLYPSGIVDGYYSPSVTKAVIAFQNRQGIKTEPATAGQAGPVTRAKLIEVYQNSDITLSSDDKQVLIVQLRTRLISLIQELIRLLQTQNPQ